MNKYLCLFLVLSLYTALYCGARYMGLLIMWNGCRGSKGVDMVDCRGPVPLEGLLMCAGAKIIFYPMMQLETGLRVHNGRVLFPRNG